jgi:phosphopantetheinyl transferase
MDIERHVVQSSVEKPKTMTEVATCRLDVRRATSAALWQGARVACDEALAQGFVFALVLHDAEAFADDSLLCTEDRQRAARFRQPRDRHNFALGRTMAHHLVRPHGAPAPCVFSLGPNGKPYLPGAPAYNLSHSGNWVACAISSHEPIGIDIEAFARLRDFRKLIPAVTHPAERHYMESAPMDTHLALFKRCWTRKEAVLKATGKGIADELQKIDVCLHLDEPVLHHPMPLRLVDLPMDEGCGVTIALALDPQVPAIAAMIIA